MITRGGMSDIIYYKKLRSMGLSEEYFFSLPFDIQNAILMAGNDDEYEASKKREDNRKRNALKQYEFEEKLKEKVKTFLKRKK